MNGILDYSRRTITNRERVLVRDKRRGCRLGGGSCSCVAEGCSRGSGRRSSGGVLSSDSEDPLASVGGVGSHYYPPFFSSPCCGMSVGSSLGTVRSTRTWAADELILFGTIIATCCVNKTVMTWESLIGGFRVTNTSGAKLRVNSKQVACRPTGLVASHIPFGHWANPRCSGGLHQQSHCHSS